MPMFLVEGEVGERMLKVQGACGFCRQVASWLLPAIAVCFGTKLCAFS